MLPHTDCKCSNVFPNNLDKEQQMANSVYRERSIFGTYLPIWTLDQ